MRTAMASLALAVMAALAGSARADIAWDFQENGSGNLHAKSQSFNSSNPSGYSITATSVTVAYGSGTNVTTSTGADNLFVKQSGSGETGLGLNGTADNEIVAGTGIVLTLTGFASPYTVTLSSVTHPDKALVYISTSSGGPWTYEGSVTSNSTLSNLSGGANILVTEAQVGYDPSANVLLAGLTVTSAVSTPEPSTVVIAGVGTIGFIAYGLRRRKARTA